MRLRAYIDARWGGSANAMAKGTGIPQRTLSRVLCGKQVLAGTALAIERASKRYPACGGDYVTVAELVDEASAAS